MQVSGDAWQGERRVDESVVNAVLTASRTLVAVATRSLGPAAEETTIAQYRALVVLASRGPQRLVRKGLIRRHRARADRRAVRVSITPAGRLVVDQATGRRRELLGDILARLPAAQQVAVADALRAFAAAAGEIPDSQWPAASPDPPVPALAGTRRDHAGAGA